MTRARLILVFATVILAGLAALLPSASAQTTHDSPTNLAAAPGPEPGEVTLTWTPPAGAMLQWVWSLEFNGTDYRWHQAAGDAGALVVDGLDAGQPHRFLVAAVFPAG